MKKPDGSRFIQYSYAEQIEMKAEQDEIRSQINMKSIERYFREKVAGLYDDFHVTGIIPRDISKEIKEVYWHK
jgi:hypothetical protein